MKDANFKPSESDGRQDGQKPQPGDIKCAEIKSIPSVMNGQRNVFKIGEYNRATASFEMNSPRASPERQTKKAEFDLNAEITPGHYFKSSFARSMLVNSNSKSKSLDYEFANAPIRKETNFWQILGNENWDLRKAQPAEVRDDLSSTGSFVSELHHQNKKADVIEEHLKNQTFLLDRPGSRASSTYQRSTSSRLDDVLFRSPLTASCRSSYRPYSSASDVDTVLLQSQVTTLQWQLRQAEASRQMHRAVLEQVVSFLQRTHKNLDHLQNRIQEDIGTINRVPRSRSVHGVDASPSILSSESNLSFQKARSVAQIPDPYCPKHGNVTWRRPRKQQYDADEVTPSKLSEEAFRLLRTVQSLLNTREPDLSSRLSSTMCSSPGNPAEVSSASSTVSAALDSDNSDNFQSQETLRGRTPVQDEPVLRSTRRRSQYAEEKNSPLQPSICSADDESGFSSLNSFQEVGLPSQFTPKTVSYHGEAKGNGHHAEEVGLPRVDDVGCKIHRRWSSTTADGQPKVRSPLNNTEILRVLWV